MFTWLLLVLIAVCTVQATRTRTCRIAGRPDSSKILVWLTCGALATLIVGPPLLLALPTFALTLAATSAAVRLLARSVGRWPVAQACGAGCR